MSLVLYIVYWPVFSESEFEATFVTLINKWCDLHKWPFIVVNDSTGIDTIAACDVNWVLVGFTGTDDKPKET